MGVIRPTNYGTGALSGSLRSIPTCRKRRWIWQLSASAARATTAFISIGGPSRGPRSLGGHLQGPAVDGCGWSGAAFWRGAAVYDSRRSRRARQRRSEDHWPLESRGHRLSGLSPRPCRSGAPWALPGVDRAPDAPPCRKDATTNHQRCITSRGWSRSPLTR